jgi:hypothetical protein
VLICCKSNPSKKGGRTTLHAFYNAKKDTAYMQAARDAGFGTVADDAQRRKAIKNYFRMPIPR